MTKDYNEKVQEAYLAPACAELPLCADAALCQTSFNNGEGGIQPGQGSDWGLI